MNDNMTSSPQGGFFRPEFTPDPGQGAFRRPVGLTDPEAVATEKAEREDLIRRERRAANRRRRAAILFAVVTGLVAVSLIVWLMIAFWTGAGSPSPTP